MIISVRLIVVGAVAQQQQVSFYTHRKNVEKGTSWDWRNIFGNVFFAARARSVRFVAMFLIAS